MMNNIYGFNKKVVGKREEKGGVRDNSTTQIQKQT
jgi:hypothetical protein